MKNTNNIFIREKLVKEQPQTRHNNSVFSLADYETTISLFFVIDYDTTIYFFFVIYYETTSSAFFMTDN